VIDEEPRRTFSVSYEVRFTPLESDGFSKKRRKKEKKTTQHRTNTVVVHKLFTNTLLYLHMNIPI
jgi:hypothetical protein